MSEELLSDPYAIAVAGGVLGSALVAERPLRRAGDRLASRLFSVEEKEEEWMVDRLEEENPDAEKFYRLLGEDELGEEVTGCTVHRQTEEDSFYGRKNALVQYASEQTGEEWAWLTETARDLQYEDFV